MRPRTPLARPVKRAAALVIRDPDAATLDRWLLVRRPSDDEELPGIWGLPAGSFAAGESVEDLVARIGRDKLGVDLLPGRRLEAGAAERAGHRLEMELWSASIEAGSPRVPQPVPGVTQYEEWRWSEPRDLETGARAGSLCCRLASRVAGRPPLSRTRSPGRARSEGPP